MTTKLFCPDMPWSLEMYLWLSRMIIGLVHRASEIIEPEPTKFSPSAMAHAMEKVREAEDPNSGKEPSTIVDKFFALEKSFLRLEKEADYLPQGMMVEKITEKVKVLIQLLWEAEVIGMSKKDIREKYLPETLRIHSLSSFIRHIQTWPHGFAGDFEVVNAIVDYTEKSPEKIGRAFGLCALSTAISQQHRNKLTHQQKIVANELKHNKSAIIVSVAAGPSRDLEKLIPEIKVSDCRIILIDSYQPALDDSMRRLAEVADHVEPIKVNVLRAASRIKKIGKPNLVYAGGLTDYLDDDQVALLENQFGPIIAEGGRYMSTNIAIGNIYRPWIQTFGEWHLIERDEEDMRKSETRLKRFGFKNYRLFKEETGLTWIQIARK